MAICSICLEYLVSSVPCGYLSTQKGRADPTLLLIETDVLWPEQLHLKPVTLLGESGFAHCNVYLPKSKVLENYRRFPELPPCFLSSSGNLIFAEIHSSLLQSFPWLFKFQNHRRTQWYPVITDAYCVLSQPNPQYLGVRAYHASEMQHE